LFLDILSSINLSIYYLSYDRKIKSNMSMIVDEKSDKVSISRLPIELLRKIERGKLEESFSLSDTFLEVAVNRVESWFRQQSITANSIGQDSINQIYIELIEKLLENEEEILEIDNPKNSKEVILDALAKLKNSNKQFIAYKLTQNFNLDKLIEIINKTSDSKIKLIENTLTPYIDGLNNKLNAIEETKNIIEIFITTLNDFYHGKDIRFNIEDGLEIISKYNDNEALKVTMLSSGEKQLLLLFCNIITAREQASIFIIDEPELSLNVVWQRELVNALLAFSEGSSIQLILASHSIELLTQYDEHVCDLINIKAL
ncbi:MAG: AAA family ATPase, partial [Campylobacterota bacterium]|nr:AAA family ATPase [Campylobacterota bacterium]